MMILFFLNSDCCVIASIGTLNSLYHLYGIGIPSQIFFIIVRILLDFGQISIVSAIFYVKICEFFEKMYTSYGARCC